MTQDRGVAGDPANFGAATKAAATHVDRAQIIKVLRSRGQHDRADWVDRELPRVVDTQRNSSLLRMLQIDPAALETAGS